MPPAKRKTLVLDMDETLIHSKFKPCSGYDFVCNVANRDRTTFSTVYVYKRPGVDMFIRRMAKLYDVCVFTASMAKYANPIIDKLDEGRNVKY